MDRHRVEIVQLLAAMPERGDEVGLFENPKMLRHRLPRHGEAVAEFVQGLSVAGVKPVQQRPPGSVGQRFEDFIHGRHNRQPNGCMSRGCFGVVHFAVLSVAGSANKDWLQQPGWKSMRVRLATILSVTFISCSGAY